MSSVNQSNVDFTPRECEINLMLMKGIQIKDMPNHSTMSYNTIKGHMQDIYLKTNTNCCLQLALWLVLHDWEITMPVN